MVVRLARGVVAQSDRIQDGDELRVIAREVWGSRETAREVRLVVVNQRGQWAGSFRESEVERVP